MTYDHYAIGAGFALAVMPAAATPEPQTAAASSAAGVIIALIALAHRALGVHADRIRRDSTVADLESQVRLLRSALGNERAALLAEFTEAVDSDRPHRDPSARLVTIDRALNNEVSDGH